MSVTSFAAEKVVPVPAAKGIPQGVVVNFLRACGRIAATSAANLLQYPHGNQTIKLWVEVVMKKVAEVIVAVVIALVFTISSAIADDIRFSGFLGNKAVYDQLKHSAGGGGAKFRWSKPGVDFNKYNKVMVDSVIFYLADNAGYKGIDPQEMKELADSFNKELVAAFRGKYPIVAEPGQDVLRIRIAITNVRPIKPGVSTVTSIVSAGLNAVLVKKEVTGGWTGSGETCAEMMILDSLTNDAIAMAVDQRKDEYELRFSKWGSAHDAFKLWSERIVMFLDYAKGMKR